MSTEDVPRQSLSVKEFAKAHGVSERHVTNLIARGELAFFKLGKLTRIPCGSESGLKLRNGNAAGRHKGNQAGWEDWDTSRLLGKSG